MTLLIHGGLRCCLENGVIHGSTQPVDDLPPIQTQFIGLMFVLAAMIYFLVLLISKPSKTWAAFRRLSSIVTGREQESEVRERSEDGHPTEETLSQWSNERRRAAIGIFCVFLLASGIIAIVTVIS